MDGLRVAVTGARKAGQLAAALERRGAVAILGPMVATDQPVDDATLLTATDRVVDAGPRWFAASTGVGMRLWAAVAERHGRLEALRSTLERATCAARGAKAVGGLRALRLEPAYVSPHETDEDVARWLLARVGPRDTVAVQVHGSATDAYHPVRETGAELLTVRPYVAGRPPEDERRARALVELVCDGALDVVTFTSPAAAVGMLELAATMGAGDRLRRALREEVAVAVIGPVTAAVFADAGIPVAVTPDRHRQGDLVRALERWHGTRPG